MFLKSCSGVTRATSYSCEFAFYLAMIAHTIFDAMSVTPIQNQAAKLKFLPCMVCNNF